jgi:hypothetical protein
MKSNSSEIMDENMFLMLTGTIKHPAKPFAGCLPAGGGKQTNR